MMLKCADEPDEAETKRIQAYFEEQQRPMKFDPYDPDNILTRREMEFMDMCHAMEENGVVRPKELSEFDFYSKLKYYDKKYKKLKAHGNRK